MFLVLFSLSLSCAWLSALSRLVEATGLSLSSCALRARRRAQVCCVREKANSVERERESEKKTQKSSLFLFFFFSSLALPLSSLNSMHHFAAANNITRTLRTRRPAQQQRNPNYNFIDSDVSDDSENEDNSAPPQHGGRLRRVSSTGANDGHQGAGAPRSATAVVQDIRLAVTRSLGESAQREETLRERVSERRERRRERRDEKKALD